MHTIPYIYVYSFLIRANALFIWCSAGWVDQLFTIIRHGRSLEENGETPIPNQHPGTPGLGHMM